MTTNPPTPETDYPLRFSVEYPDRLDRLSTALRIFWIIPIAIVFDALASILFAPVLLMLVFRKKYPAWWFDWNLQLSRFEARVCSYFLLLRDEYPSTDEEQALRLEIDPPNAETLNRWLPLVKWFLVIPHYIVLLFLGIGVFFVTIFAWFAILFTGRYPKSAFGFVVGVVRWVNRVSAYAFLLTTDRYPPFSLD
jgi:hypothetical protein